MNFTHNQAIFIESSKKTEDFLWIFFLITSAELSLRIFLSVIELYAFPDNWTDDLACSRLQPSQIWLWKKLLHFYSFHKLFSTTSCAAVLRANSMQGEFLQLFKYYNVKLAITFLNDLLISVFYLNLSSSKAVKFRQGCESLFKLNRPEYFVCQLALLFFHQVINFFNVRHKVFVWKQNNLYILLFWYFVD